jgi:hypothetical protein
MRRADAPTAVKSSRASPRFEIDRTWLWRGCLALAVIGFIVLIAKASMMLFGSGSKRLERQERASEQPSATQPAARATSPQQ